GPAGSCPEGQSWDIRMGHCMPAPESTSRGISYGIHARAFFTGISQQGPRGRDAFAVPNFVMAGFSRPLDETHTIQLDLMLTAELWTFPKAGYPLLLQSGEENEDGVPFIDAQHPHSSPIMGLTLSDRIRLGIDTQLKLFFAPRGESADGP